MRLTNMEQWRPILDEAEDYILGLTDNCGEPLCKRNRKKTGFTGFLVNINSVNNVFQEYVAEKMYLKYLLNYKLSGSFRTVLHCSSSKRWFQ